MFGKEIFNRKSSIVKIALSLILFGALLKGFIDFSTKIQFSELYESLGSPFFLFLVVLLLIPNLYCEARKWQSLVSFQVHSPQVYKAILAGYSSALLSPNRTGEFMGRVSFFPKAQRTELTASTFAGSLIQGLVTILFGLIGLAFLPLELDIISVDRLSVFLIPGLVILMLVIILGGISVRIRKEIYRILETIASIELKDFYSSFFWAILRYLVFASQFYLALELFNYQGSFSYALAGISTMYLLQSYVPLTSLGELGVREFLSLLLFGAFMPHSFIAVFPAFLIWIINIVVPSISGWLILRNQHIPDLVR